MRVRKCTSFLSSRVPGLMSWTHGSMDMHSDTLLLVTQWQSVNFGFLHKNIFSYCVSKLIDFIYNLLLSNKTNFHDCDKIEGLQTLILSPKIVHIPSHVCIYKLSLCYIYSNYSQCSPCSNFWKLSSFNRGRTEV